MFDKLVWQRGYRKANQNRQTHAYEKTVNGFLMRLYRNMQSRTVGVQSKKAHLYKGLVLLDRNVFYQWAKQHPDFNKMFQIWEASGYNRKLTPTVDRIDSSVGYELPNMRWLTHSVNSSRRLNV